MQLCNGALTLLEVRGTLGNHVLGNDKAFIEAGTVWLSKIVKLIIESQKPICLITLPICRKMKVQRFWKITIFVSVCVRAGHLQGDYADVGLEGFEKLGAS